MISKDGEKDNKQENKKEDRLGIHERARGLHEDYFQCGWWLPVVAAVAVHRLGKG